MLKLSLDQISSGERLVLARPIILGSGVKGLNSGVELTERVASKLKELGFAEVWVREIGEEQQEIFTGGDEDEITQTEKYLRIKQEIANSLADIMSEKDPEREMLRIRSMSRNMGALKKGALTSLDPNRSTSEVKIIKQFSESIISTAKLENFLKTCRNLLEGPLSPLNIDKVLINLNDNRVEGNYLYNHMANCGLYFLATLARYNADLKKKGAVSSELKYTPAFDHRKRKETLFYFSDEEILSGALGAFMHDLGYLHDGMPEILFKDGIITPEEHNILKRHVEVSINLIQYHIFFANRPLAKNVIENHHERLDGKGYPKGSKNFHFFSRILGMLDVFDSMTTDRPWRKKFARSKVLEWLYENSKAKTTEDGTILEPMFDRDLVMCFERILMLYEVSEMVDIYHQKTPHPIFRCRIVELNPGRPDRPVVELMNCLVDPNKDVKGKILNMLSSKDLYLGESTSFKKDQIF